MKQEYWLVIFSLGVVYLIGLHIAAALWLTTFTWLGVEHITGVIIGLVLISLFEKL